MARVLLDMAISLDGFVGRPDETDPGLYDWYFDPPAASRPVVDELVETTGAIVIGRGAFGTGDDAGGWDDTPYKVQHFVLTHRPPAKAPGGGVEFVFVPEGVHRAIELARAAAGDRYVTIGGGADVARQFLAAGLVDELQLHVVPVLLGSGIALFGHAAPQGQRNFSFFGHAAPQGQRKFPFEAGPELALTKLRVVDSPIVTHVRYRIDGPRTRS